MTELKEKIQNGEYKVNEKLPSESELQSIFGVSRVTLRQAVNQLVQEGLIEKIQGSGSFVRKPPKVRKKLSFNTEDSFSLTAKKNGFKPSTKIVTFAKKKPSKELIDDFGFEETDYLNIKRVLYLDSQPSVVDDSYIPSPFYDSLNEQIVKDSLYKALTRIKKVDKLCSDGSVVGATQANSELADLLEKPFGCALLTINNKMVNSKKQAVQYSREYIDPLVYQIKIR